MKSIIVVLSCLAALPVWSQVFKGSHEYKAEVMNNSLQSPWGMAVGPLDQIYITEKSGSIVVVDNGQIINRLSGIPKDLSVVGQGGLLDIVFHPNFQTQPFVYLTYSTQTNAQPQGGVNTRVSRFELVGSELSNEKILAQGAFGTDGAHFGSRMAFDHKNNLFVTFGERHNKEKAQELQYLNGKVIRIKDDGAIPADNPFINVPGARAEIWTLGHRNPQGIDIHPVSGKILISEHGPSGYDANLPGVGPVGLADEVNILKEGGNYGWPILFGDPDILPWTSAMNKFASQPGVIGPLREFTIPDGIAPAGAAFYTGNLFPKWKNDFFVAALRGYIIRMKIDSSGQLVEEEKIIPTGYSRLRDVMTGADGKIYALTGNQLIRIEPAN